MAHIDTKTDIINTIKSMRKTMKEKNAYSCQIYLAGNITDEDLNRFRDNPIVYDTPYLSINLALGRFSTFYPH